MLTACPRREISGMLSKIMPSLYLKLFIKIEVDGLQIKWLELVHLLFLLLYTIFTYRYTHSV
jgi:hypothetical protein